MGTNRNADTDRVSYGLVSNVLIALLVGVVVGGFAASDGGVGGLAAVGLVAGVALGLGSMAAVPALLRIVW